MRQAPHTNGARYGPIASATAIDGRRINPRVLLGMKQHDGNSQALGIALCGAEIGIVTLHSMLQPTIRIDGQAKDIDHTFAHTRQMFADKILLMHGLQRMPNIHDAIDQHQQPYVRHLPRDLQRDATGQAGGHETDGSTGPLSWPRDPARFPDQTPYPADETA